MFGNFIYFIVALLIYTTYQPAGKPPLPPHMALSAFAAVSLLFFALTGILFNYLERKASRIGIRNIEEAYHGLVTRQSILALAVFAVDIYLIDFGSHLNRVTVFNIIPTLEALLFLCLFILYLSVVWAFSHNVHERLFRTGNSRLRFVLSNISFAVPVLLPWFFLSVIADVITALPYEAPEEFLMSTQGQVLYFLFFLMIIAILGPALIQRFWGCRPLNEGYDRFRIEQICHRAGLSYREIMLWPLFGGKMITAGVMGLVRRFRYILVTPALLRHLDPIELDAVIAHEIGHVKQKHLVFYLFFFVGYLVIAFAALDMVIYAILYSDAAFGWIGQEEAGASAPVSIVFSIAMISIFFIYFRYVFGYFMRNFERQADTYVYRLLESARPLITTLKKIAAGSGQSPDRPNWHHFSITERVNYLEKCEVSRSWIARHNRKIHYSIIGYLALMLVIGYGGYTLHYGDAGRALSTGVFEKIIQEQIEKNPGNPELYLLLGDMHQSTGNLPGAATAYEEALSMDPDDPRALNNLAWLYATADASRFRRPELALELARRAARISPAPHILDTLAESYFVNGMQEAAVAAEEEALAKAVENHSYYRKQLRRFKDAAGS